MVWLLLLLSFSVQAQIDLKAIQELDDELPEYSQFINTEDEVSFARSQRRYRPPVRKITIEEIAASGTSKASLKNGAILRNIESNVNYTTQKLMYVDYYNQEDEFGFKYLVSPEKKILWKTKSLYVNPIREELVMFEKPHKYTPAPTNIIRREFDNKIRIPPEVSIYTGLVTGDYVVDLFEDKKARNGKTSQFGVHFFTEWKLPLKVGAALHYERTTYQLRGGGNVQYTAYSLGPQVKSRDFEIFGQALRLQTMFRIGPFARMEAQTQFGSGTFKFNSADVLTSIEGPIKNAWGEFVLGLFYQTQWLNLRDQNVPVSLSPTNQTNRAFGLSFAQVFQ